MKKLFLLIATILAISSCSSEEEIEQLSDIKLLEKTLLTNCDGYGFFSDPEYDCGWKRGYTDWVYHYNTTVNQLNYDPCNKIRVVTLNGSASLVAGQTSASHSIIQLTQNNNQSYYDNLFDDLSTEFLKGKAAGYSIARGQQPYAAADPACF
jgi:hypothetical protein